MVLATMIMMIQYPMSDHGKLINHAIAHPNAARIDESTVAIIASKMWSAAQLQSHTARCRFRLLFVLFAIFPLST
jgi:hypothetical protein